MSVIILCFRSVTGAPHDKLWSCGAKQPTKAEDALSVRWPRNRQSLKYKSCLNIFLNSCDTSFIMCFMKWSDLIKAEDPCFPIPGPRLPWRRRWHQDHRQMQLPGPQPTDPAMRKRPWPLPSQHATAKQLGLAGWLGLTRVDSGWLGLTRVDSGWLGLTSLKLGLWWPWWLVLAVLAICFWYLLIHAHKTLPFSRFQSWMDDLSREYLSWVNNREHVWNA